MIDDAVGAHERLIDALAADILGAQASEVLDSHPGHAARVVADATRQAIRRCLAAASDPAATLRNPLGGPMPPSTRQEKKP